MEKKTTQAERARMGALGESLVVAKLMEHGWDAFNANCTIKNFKTIDIVCIDGNSTDPKSPWKPNIALVQVKTSVQSNIPAGFTMAQCLDKEYLEKNVMGPYVFVSAIKEDGTNYKFRYFILSRRMFIDLIHAAHKYAIYGYKRKTKEAINDDPNYINGVKITAPAGLYLRWMKGESDKANNLHVEFNNPLEGIDCENAWENIWKD
ncbi:MAG: hypothetical protein K2G64_06440 [Muribaculaceae bacterium]|nr:hypothetical protein [Muribaculaceae bacterium]